MLHLLLGTDWTANRDEVMKRIAADVAGRRGNRILMVPELISHETERRLCAAAGDTASRYAEVLSFTRLARRVADSMGSAAEECLDNGGRVVAMASAAKNLSSRLKAYAAVETKPEFLTGLIDAVDEFKRCCISSADLSRAAGETEGSLAQKLEELSLLMESYDALCSRGKRDPRDQMTWLLEQMEQGDFAREHVFYIDGFPDFTRQHLAILEHLIQASPDVTVSLNCDREGSRLLAFEKAGDTASQLLRPPRRGGREDRDHSRKAPGPFSCAGEAVSGRYQLGGGKGMSGCVPGRIAVPRVYGRGGEDSGAFGRRVPLPGHYSGLHRYDGVSAPGESGLSPAPYSGVSVRNRGYSAKKRHRHGADGAGRCPERIRPEKRPALSPLRPVSR